MSSVELTVPDLGNFNEVSVVEVLVKTGEHIEIDTPLLTLETDKASMDVPSTAAGVIGEVLVKAGDKVSKGTPILRLQAAAPVAAAPASPAPTPTPTPAPAPAAAAPTRSVSGAQGAESGFDRSTQLLVLGSGPGGYSAAFGVLAVLQAALTAAVAFGLLGLTIAGSVWGLLGMAVLSALLGSSLGLFLSAFARTEFQAVQFLPAFVLPQLLLCGLFVPRASMAPLLHWISWALPLTYALDGVTKVASAAPLSGSLGRDVAVLALSVPVAVVAGALTLRRRTA